MKKVFVSVIPKKNANPEEIKQVLKPYIRRGIVKCVSDSPTEKNTVEVSIKSTRQGYLPVIQKILKNNGYQVTIKKTTPNGYRRIHRGHYLRLSNKNVLMVSAPKPPKDSDPFPPSKPEKKKEDD